MALLIITAGLQDLFRSINYLLELLAVRAVVIDL
jgi:hypothetical protein